MRTKAIPWTALFNRERVGWVIYDWANSAYVLCVITVLGSAYFIVKFEQAAREGGGVRHGGALAIPLGNLPMTPEAAWSLIIAVSALIVALSSPLLGRTHVGWRTNGHSRLSQLCLVSRTFFPRQDR